MSEKIKKYIVFKNVNEVNETDILLHHEYFSGMSLDTNDKYQMKLYLSDNKPKIKNIFHKFSKRLSNIDFFKEFDNSQIYLYLQTIKTIELSECYVCLLFTENELMYLKLLL